MCIDRAMILLVARPGSSCRKSTYTRYDSNNQYLPFMYTIIDSYWHCSVNNSVQCIKGFRYIVKPVGGMCRPKSCLWQLWCIMCGTPVKQIGGDNIMKDPVYIHCPDMVGSVNERLVIAHVCLFPWRMEGRLCIYECPSRPAHAASWIDSP